MTLTNLHITEDSKRLGWAASGLKDEMSICWHCWEEGVVRMTADTGLVCLECSEISTAPVLHSEPLLICSVSQLPS